MLKNKFIKILLPAFIVVIVLWVAMPTLYTKGVFQSNHTTSSVDAQAKLQAPENSEIDNYKKPVYFNILKFVNNFIPVKHEE